MLFIFVETMTILCSYIYNYTVVTINIEYIVCFLKMFFSINTYVVINL